MARTIPKISQQLSKLTAICVSSVCLLSFNAPADASNLDDLVTDTTLIRIREADDIFVEDSEVIEKSKSAIRRGSISFERFVMSNSARTISRNVGALRFISRGKFGDLNGHLTTLFTYPLKSSFNTNDTDIKMRSFAGINGLLINNGKNKMSYAFLMVNAAIGSGATTHSIFSHLLHLNKKNMQVVALGYEYTDTDLSAIAGDRGDNDGIRTQGVSMYRASVNLPLTEYLLKNDSIAINVKLNSSMQLGSIRATSLGISKQQDLNRLFKGADLNHSLHHTAGISVRTILANERIKLILTGSRRDTIRGTIRKEQQNTGKFDATNTTIVLLGSINAIPEYKVFVEARISRFSQMLTAESTDGEQYMSDNKRTMTLLSIRKLY